MQIDVKCCAEILKKKDNIAVLCHRDPDGDTIGSAMALCDTLALMGKKVKMRCVSPIPENLKFIFREYEDFQEEFVVAVDISSEKMLGDGDVRKTHVDLCIDHHGSNTFFADKTFLCNYSSAGEVIFDVINAMGVAPSAYAATCLLTAVSSDTGSFKYSGVTSKTMRCGASLLDLGADRTAVRVNLYESTEKARIMVEGMALSSMEFFAKDKIAIISISLDMMDKCNADETQLEGIASVPITVKVVSVGITLKERDDGSVRVSVRSNEEVDSCKICTAFEGGGHIRASGCRIYGTLQEAKEKLLNEARKQVE